MKRKFAFVLTLVLLTFFSFNTFAFAAAPPKLTATMPSFKVTVNGQIIDNANSRYPLLVYKGITYFPMTWDYTRALGLRTGWDSAEGFSIDKDPSLAGAELKQDLGYANNVNAENIVTMANFKVKVNGKIIDNSNEEYPLLVFRDITYFPMTWRFAVTEFGLKTSWDSVEGFGIMMDAGTQANSTNRKLMEPVEIAATAGSGVVYIEVYDKEGYLHSVGSGFIVTADGLVVTNAHVIAGGYSAKLRLTDGKMFDVEGVTAFDFDRDIAVLKINGSDLPTVKLGNSDEIALGQRVVAIGSPMGFENTISEGLISSKNRTIGDYNYIQTTAPVSPGSSGGALLDYYGEVVGIPTLTFLMGQNLNLAIPINDVKGYIKNDRILPASTNSNNKLYVMTYAEYGSYLAYSAAYMFVDGYYIPFHAFTVTEYIDTKGESTIYLYYYVSPDYASNLFNAVFDENQDAIEDLFIDVVDNLMEYYNKEVIATMLYYNTYEEYPEGLEYNSIYSDTIRYDSEQELWRVMFPVLEISTDMAEEMFYYRWWYDE